MKMSDVEGFRLLEIRIHDVRLGHVCLCDECAGKLMIGVVGLCVRFTNNPVVFGQCMNCSKCVNWFDTLDEDVYQRWLLAVFLNGYEGDVHVVCSNCLATTMWTQWTAFVALLSLDDNATSRWRCGSVPIDGLSKKGYMKHG